MKQEFINWCKKAWKKLKLVWRELGNFFTNLFCPLLSIVAGICEFFQMPSSVIAAIKKAEEWCYKACGTKEKIDGMVEKIDDAVEKLEGER